MVSRRHAGHRSFPRDNPREYCKRETDSENLVFSGFSLYSEFLSDTTKTHKIFTVTNTNLAIPKGKRERIKMAAFRLGMSVNEYLYERNMIKYDMTTVLQGGVDLYS